jgi:hypothetical protein
MVRLDGVRVIEIKEGAGTFNVEEPQIEPVQALIETEPKVSAFAVP